MSSSEKVKLFLDDAKRAKVEVRGPDLRRSRWHFVCEGDAIRYGLGAIKGTGEKSIEKLLETRDAMLAERSELAFDDLVARTDPQEVPRLAWEALIKAGALDYTGENRGVLSHSLDSAIAEAARLTADRKAGQGSLFGVASPQAAAASAPARNGSHEAHAWNRADTLRAEREALGFYLSGHPLEERASLFALLSTTKTSELASRQGGEVVIAGLVVGLSEVIVKSGSLAGRKMARFRLEDLEGSVPVTVFPRTYDEQKGRFAEDTLIVARAKLEEHAEEPALILEEALSIEEALKRFEGGLVVELAPDDRERLEPLRNALASHPGRNPVYFLVNGDDGYLRRVSAGRDVAVAISAELAERVDTLLGRGRVRLARM
jgi:DNA polymerase-3 subunit alpha